MSSPFPFETMLAFGFLSIMLLLGALVRAKVRFVQRYLFPSCLLGGVMGIILVNLNLVKISTSQLETMAYHFFNISFISLGLTRDNHTEAQPRAARKKFLQGSLWMALTQGITFPLQAVVGGLLVIVFGWFGQDLFKTFGFLLPLGFNEGPGQALSFGKVWETSGFTHGATIGLTFAAMGFFFSFFVGVPLANWGIRKGLASHGSQKLSRDFMVGLLPKSKDGESAGRLKMHSSNIDSMAFQASMVGLVYVLTYFTVDLAGQAFGLEVAKMFWGFFFFFGLLLAVLVRWVMDRLGVGYLLDEGVQKRITGWSVDFLIVATIPAIQLAVVWAYILPIACMSLVNGMLTTLVVVYLGRRLVSENLERMLSIYGTVTGTVSCGLLLLRMADPEFETSVAIELAMMNLFVFPFLTPCIVLVNAPVLWNWNFGLTLLAFVGVGLVSFMLMKVFKLLGEPKF